jgi:hypothetical protein
VSLLLCNTFCRHSAFGGVASVSESSKTDWAEAIGQTAIKPNPITVILAIQYFIKDISIPQKLG